MPFAFATEKGFYFLSVLQNSNKKGKQKELNNNQHY